MHAGRFVYGVFLGYSAFAVWAGLGTAKAY